MLKKSNAFDVMMKKVCILFLILIMCNNHLLSMDRPIRTPLPIIPHFIFEQEIFKHIISKFTWGKNTFLHEDIAYRLKILGNVNKEWRAFFNKPIVFRAIMRNYFSYIPSCTTLMDTIRSLNLKSAKEYFTISQTLNTTINTLTKKEIKNYIEKGADPHYCDNSCAPVLFIADVPRTKILLALGVDPNMELSPDETPLSWAIVNKQNFKRKQQLKQVQQFLAYNPRKKCLRTAIAARDKEILRLLLNQGNISGKEIIEATHYADSHFPAGLKLLAKYTKKLDMNTKSQALFDVLRERGSTIAKIEALLYAGAHVNHTPNKESDCLLALIFDQESYETIKLLLAHGANLNSAHKTITPLQLAIRLHDIRLAQLLLAYKPQDLCLSTVITFNNPRMAQLVLENGLNTNDLYGCIHVTFKEKAWKVAAVFINAYLGNKFTTALLNIFEYNEKHPTQKKHIMPILERLCSLNTIYLRNFRINFIKDLKKIRRFIRKHHITQEEIFDFICSSLEGSLFNGRDKNMLVARYITIYLGYRFTAALLGIFAYNDQHPYERKKFLPILRLLCNLPDKDLTEFRTNAMRIL